MVRWGGHRPQGAGVGRAGCLLGHSRHRCAPATRQRAPGGLTAPRGKSELFHRLRDALRWNYTSEHCRFNCRALASTPLLPQGLALKMMAEVRAPRPLSCLCTWDGASGFNCGAWFLLPSGLGDQGSWWGLSSLVCIAYRVLPLLAWVLVTRHTAFVTLLITQRNLLFCLFTCFCPAISILWLVKSKRSRKSFEEWVRTANSHYA